MTFIKRDPELQEEQDDLIMSYLNADYLSEQPLSPPDSTTSSDTSGSPEKQMVDSFSPDKQLVDEFMFDQGSTDFFNHPNWLDTTTNTALPLYNQDLLNSLPFYLNTPILPQQQQQQPIEQPKKKRGRKKRDSVQPAATAAQVAIKPLAPKPLIKIETSIPIEEQQQQPPAAVVVKPEVKVEQTQEAQKQLLIQKRQERLIKNRAAALLSRKRKREHLTNLEDENKKLVEENEQLSEKVSVLENKLQLLEKENMDLKAKLYPDVEMNQKSFHTPKTTKTTSVVFMIMLFSFALFSLPYRMTTNQLTVGGSSSSAFEHKKQFPLLGSSSYEEKDTTDLILIDSVRPRDLQTWINHKLDVSQEEEDEEDSIYDKFIHWYQPTTSQQDKSNKSQVYLYSKEFSQLASSLNHDDESLPPLISIFSPYNQTVEEDQCDSYLQIDVQVLRSSVIKGQLFSLEKYGTPTIALLDGIKNEYIHNVTRSNQDDSIVKREKRTRKLSKVL